ncbi:MAG: hypothetical protein IE937_00615 [Gammaproteobacteria bacterium]|nr:hypothetical protein [Gammaproteobacteria bacterium]MBD3775528.1 hypothetical protein [Thiotrichales bacterium]
MSCCSGGYCQFKFPEGPPLVDNPVTSLNANYQFLPYGTLLEAGEVIRIWMESGEARTVILEEKLPLEFTLEGPRVKADGRDFPWQLIAMDSGIAYEDLMDWSNHPLFNPQTTSVLLVFSHPIEPKLTLKDYWLRFLYKMRNL